MFMLVHRHHIIPKHMGGSDDPSNIIELTVEEHAQAHLVLYEEHGKYEDLCAYLMLSGKNTDPEFIRSRAILAGTASQKKRRDCGLTGVELFYGREVTSDEMHLNSSKGGKIGGKKNAESGHILRIREMVDLKEAGKKGGKATMAGGKGSFADPIERLKAASNGGKIGGKKNVASGHLKNISKLSKRNTGMMWITNGIQNKMILKSDIMPEGFWQGRNSKQ